MIDAVDQGEAANSVAAFPTTLAGVTTASDANGLVGPDGVAQRQQLVLIPGQFIAAPGAAAGIGSQTLYRQMAGQVYYSNSTDWTPPKVGGVGIERTPVRGTARVSVLASISPASPGSSPCTRRVATGTRSISPTTEGPSRAR